MRKNQRVLKSIVATALIACASLMLFASPSGVQAQGDLNSKSQQAAQIMMAVCRIPANARARGCQQAQLRPRQIAGADQQHRPGLQIQKYRQESHATLASPTSGVD